MIYFILGVRSGSLTFLVTMSANCRPPHNYPVLYHPSCTSALSLVLKYYHYIFHPWCQVRFTYIIKYQCLPTVDLLHTNLFYASYTSLHSLQNAFSCNVSSMFGILTIISHAHGRFAIQDNQRSFQPSVG